MFAWPDSAVRDQPGLPVAWHPSDRAPVQSRGGKPWSVRSSDRSTAWMVQQFLPNIEGVFEGVVSAVHRNRKRCATKMSRTAGGDVRRQPIAELADRAVAACSRQHNVGRTERVAMRVRDRDAASDQPDAVDIVDVVADVKHV